MIVTYGLGYIPLLGKMSIASLQNQVELLKYIVFDMHNNVGLEYLCTIPSPDTDITRLSLTRVQPDVSDELAPAQTLAFQNFVTGKVLHLVNSPCH